MKFLVRRVQNHAVRQRNGEPAQTDDKQLAQAREVVGITKDMDRNGLQMVWARYDRRRMRMLPDRGWKAVPALKFGNAELRHAATQ